MAQNTVPMLAWVNGKIGTPEEARVSVFDRGFLFGDGVYETGRSFGRSFLFLEEHLKRIRTSAKKLYIPVPWSDAEITQSLVDVAQKFGREDIYFRTVITRGAMGAIGIEVWDDAKPTLVHLLQTLNPEKIAKVQKEGMKVLTSTVVRNSAKAQDPNIKTSNYLNSLLALQDVKSRGADDAILCDASGVVTEGTTFSIFAVTAEGKLITPSLEVGILDSITRRHVMNVAGEIPVEEGAYQLEAFQKSAEIFIASSIREIAPIREWDGKKYPPLGPVTAKLQARLKEDIQKYVKANPHY